jgi:proteasome assembly chaperone (PAC2) family protein
MSLKTDIQREIDNLEMRLKDNTNSLQQLKEIKNRLERVKLSEFEEDLREEDNKQILLKG